MGAIVVPRISPYTMAKYQRIIQFAVSPHSIHIQVRRDLDKQWLLFPYKITAKDLDAIVQDWLGNWCIPVIQEDLDKETPPEAPKDPASLELCTHDSNNESSTDPEDAA